MPDCKTTLPDGRRVTKEEFMEELQAAQQRVIDEIDDPDSTLVKGDAIVPPYKTDPRAGVSVVNMGDMVDGIAGAGGIEKATRVVAPDLILSQSASPLVRSFTKAAFKSAFYRNGELEGIATNSAEIAIKSRMVKNSLLVNDIERAARESVKDKSFNSKKDFNEALWSTATGGRTASGRVGEIAGRIRTEVFLPLLEELKAAKLIDEPQGVNERFIMNYVSRMYDTGKIAQQRLKFKSDMIKPWLERKMLARIGAIEDNAELLAKDKIEQLVEAKKDFNEVDRIADETINNILGMKKDTTFFATVSGSSGFKSRVIDISDKDLAGWLVTNDMPYLVTRYVTNAARALETDKLYKSFGVKSRDELVVKIKEDYLKLVGNAKTEKEINKLNKQLRSDLANLNTSIDRMTGITLGDPMSMTNRVIRGAKVFNFVTSLGQMTVSAIPDVAQVMSIPSIGGTKAIKQLGQFAGALFGDKKLREMVLAKKAQARKAIGLLELQRGSRLRSLADVFDEAPNVTKFEQGLGYLSDKFGKFSLMDYWNDSAKIFSSMLTVDLITESVEAIAKGTAKSTVVRDLANMGIGKAEAEAISGQMRLYPPDKVGNIQKTELWDDSILDMMNNAILKSSQDVVITPGAAQVTRLSTDNLFGQLFFQFKSFMIASNSSILIKGLQRRDANAFGGLVTAIALGAMVEYLKNTIAGRESPTDPRAWVLAGITNSGVLSIPIEILNTIDKVSGGTISLSRAIGLEDGAKYRNRSTASMLLGVTAGKVDTLAGLWKGILEGQFTESELKKLRALTPYGNLFYIKYLMTLMDDDK